MDRSNILAALAKMSRRRPEAIEGHMSLTSLGIGSSFGLSALRSLLEAGGSAKLPVFTAQIKVDDLVGLTAGGSTVRAPAPSARPAPSHRPVAARPIGAIPLRSVGSGPSANNFGLGMDMQEISVLPETSDFHSDHFYSSHFSSSEIATATLRPSPRAHLCGLFCAKEALKKSHPDLLDLRMSDIAVAHDASGRPHIALIDPTSVPHPFQFLISITHTAQIAAAACVTLWG